MRKEFYKSAIYLTLLFLPLLGWQLDLNYHFKLVENRELSRLPQVSLKGSFVEQAKGFEKYFNDHLGFRPIFVRLNRLIKVEVLKSSPNRAVTLGKNDWLFHTPELEQAEYINLEPYSQDELKLVQKNFEEISAAFSQKGIKFYVLIAPNASSIYPEYLPDHLRNLYHKTKLKQLTAYLKTSNPKFNYVDPTEALLANKSLGQLYYKYDLHWNHYGSFVAYQELMKKVRADFPQITAKNLTDYEIKTEISEQVDLEDFLGISDYKKELHPVFIPKFSKQAKISEKECPNIYKRCGEIITTLEDKKFPVAVIYRDSFGSWLVPFWKEHFRKATYLWLVYPTKTDRVFAEKANLVIFEISERNLRDFTQKLFTFN